MLTVPGAEQLLTSHVWTSCVPKLRGNFHASQTFSKNDNEFRGVGARSCAKKLSNLKWLMEVANRHSIINKNWFHIDLQVKLNKEAVKYSFSALKMLKNVISELKIV